MQAYWRLLKRFLGTDSWFSKAIAEYLKHHGARKSK